MMMQNGKECCMYEVLLFFSEIRTFHLRQVLDPDHKGLRILLQYQYYATSTYSMYVDARAPNNQA